MAVVAFSRRDKSFVMLVDVCGLRYRQNHHVWGEWHRGLEQRVSRVLAGLYNTWEHQLLLQLPLRLPLWTIFINLGNSDYGCCTQDLLSEQIFQV